MTSVVRLTRSHISLASSLRRVPRLSYILLAPYSARVYDAVGNESGAIASPMKLFEYMATGKPIVATALPGVLEVMEHGRTGLVIPPDDRDSFVAALTRLAAEPELRESLGRAAREQYERNHTWRRASSILEALA